MGAGHRARRRPSQRLGDPRRGDGHAEIHEPDAADRGPRGERQERARGGADPPGKEHRTEGAAEEEGERGDDPRERSLARQELPTQHGAEPAGEHEGEGLAEEEQRRQECRQRTRQERVLFEEIDGPAHRHRVRGEARDEAGPHPAADGSGSSPRFFVGELEEDDARERERRGLERRRARGDEEAREHRHAEARPGKEDRRRSERLDGATDTSDRLALGPRLEWLLQIFGRFERPSQRIARRNLGHGTSVTRGGERRSDASRTSRAACRAPRRRCRAAPRRSF
jgi:hypothetical protein